MTPPNVVRSLVMAALLFSSPASALTMSDAGFFDGPTLIDFESDFPAGGFESHTLGDVEFSTTAGFPALGILDLGFGASLVDITGSMTVTFANSAVRVGFDYMAGTPVYLEAYDEAGELLNIGDTGGVTGIGFLGYESIVPIGSIIIHDTGLRFMVDNLRYDASPTFQATSVVPEPTAALLFSIGMLTAASAKRRGTASR